MMAFRTALNPVASSGGLPVSGASLWLDASVQTSLFTDAGVTNVSSQGDLVYQWNDLSGNGRHAVQATSGNRPLWNTPANGQNGLSTLSFNGSSTYLISSGSGQSSAFTAYLVFLRSNSAGTQIPLEWGVQSTGLWRSMQNYYGNTTFDGGLYFAGYFRDVSATSLKLPYSTCSLMSVSYDGTTTTVRRDGGNVSGSPVLNTATTLNLNIGRSVLNSYFLNGKIMEVVLYPSSHNSTQYSLIRQYCQTKWGTP